MKPFALDPSAPTPQLLTALQRRLRFQGAVRGTLYGAAEEAYMADMWDRVEATTKRVIDVLASPGTHSLDIARGKLLESYAEFRQEAAETIAVGANAAGDAILTLADRVARAYAKLGKGAGEAWREFWGTDPKTLGLGVVITGVLVALGLGYLLLTPGGQAVLMGGGSLLKGSGKAVAKAVL